MGKTSKLFTFLLLCILSVPRLHADYPQIERLSRSDILFLQLEESVSEYYRASAGNLEIPSLQIYAYTTKEEQSIFSLASRCNLTYETIATLNRLDRSGRIESGTKLLIPNMPGLFVPFEAKTELEHLLHQSMENDRYESYPIVVFMNSDKVPYHFMPGNRFTSEELSYFLGIYFQSPIAPGIANISSLYGQRRNPFTGDLQFHYGIDLAAETGTEVFAARRGTVIRKGYDDIYGYYVVLKHPGNYKSFYGHLSYIAVELNQIVKSGSIVGTVGSTGVSTGPHLHFEIWKNDAAVDPLPLLPKDY